MDESRRRRFLTRTGGATLLALTGCLGSRERGATPTATHAPAETTSEPTAETTSEPTTDGQPESMSSVFHFSGDESSHEHAVANVANLLDDDSIDLGDVAFVANGRGINLLVEGETTVADSVRSLVEEGVTFCACHNSMEAFGVTEDELLSTEIRVVPSGVGALTEYQSKDGYAYIKTP